MIKIWYDSAWGAVMAKHGDDTIRMVDREDNTERAEILGPASKIGSKDGGNWVTPYSEELWSGIKRIGTLLMIRVEYKMEFAATFAFYDGLGVKIKDTAEVSEKHKELFREIDEVGISTGVGSCEVSYSKKLWDALLAEGERVG